jgi:hypothetical protein
VTGWERVVGGRRIWGKEWMRRIREKLGGKTMDCSTRGGGKVKRLRIGIRE